MELTNLAVRELFASSPHGEPDLEESQSNLQARRSAGGETNPFVSKTGSIGTFALSLFRIIEIAAGIVGTIQLTVSNKTNKCNETVSISVKMVNPFRRPTNFAA